jgi:anti-anti-sigma factor
MRRTNGIDIKEIREAEHIRLAVSGHVDLGTAWQLDGALGDLTERGADTVVDLSGVTAIDPCGLRVLLAAQARSTPDCGMTIEGARPHVDRVVDGVGLTGRLSFAA